MTQPLPHPRVDALEKLLQVFTIEQLMIFAGKCQEVQARGWGDVVIRFSNAHPDTVCVTESEKLPKP